MRKSYTAMNIVLVLVLAGCAPQRIKDRADFYCSLAGGVISGPTQDKNGRYHVLCSDGTTAIMQGHTNG